MDHSIWNTFFIFGCAVTVFSVCVLINQFVLNLRCTEKTKGMIVRGVSHEREPAMMLTFTVEGKSYRLPFGDNSKMSPGDNVTVAYNPRKINRSSCYVMEDVSNSKRIAVIGTIIGIVSMLVGYGMFIGLIAEFI